jgi:hypothetical protein
VSKQLGAYRAELGDGDAAGGILAVANPEGVDLIVTDLILNVNNVATGACTVDGGIAANATTSSDNLIDGQDVHAAAGVFAEKAGNAKRAVLWGASQYLTISMATGAAADLEGYAYIKYIHA